MNGFARLGLREELLRAIAEAGYTEPTPIQQRAIPAVLEGRDVIGIAQTGTGKTASFTLPMLQILAAGRSRARMPRALILSPTRELATQTAHNFDLYGKYLALTKALLIGGVGMADQERLLDRGVDVLIATPGRLLDWFERGKVLLGGVQLLVIDEADRMLDMGFIPDVERIVGLLPNRRQTLLFSATMGREVRRLADRFLRDPVAIEVTPPARKAESVDDAFVPVTGRDKRQLLEALLTREGIETAMIFCNTKREVASLTRWLVRRGVDARELHGDLEQTARQAALDAFRRGEVKFLVATDVAARGLDIDDMPVVINYDVPHTPDDYVHRIGRTGRAGRRGRAFTLVSETEARAVAAIERATGRAVPRLDISLEEAPAERFVPRTEPARASIGGRRARAAGAAASTPVGGSDGAGSGAKVAANEGKLRPRAEGTRRSEASRTQSPERAAPVVGLGDHVPRFLMREVPLRKLASSEAE
ncbi:ATP-dependent RNA helicase RhlE [bacterium HR40]|nr:ATP-dependent RNA helicase RhlE [bacterium HR40]